MGRALCPLWNRLPLVLVPMVCLAAEPARTARVTDLRIGEHPGFTRVVFEFDVMPEYSVAFDRAANAEEVLVVRFDASLPVASRRGQGRVRRIEIRRSGAAALARVQLSRRGLRIAETTLANPPRLVLDLRDP